MTINRSLVGLFLSFLLVLLVAPGSASFLGSELVVPSVGRGEGSGGSRWYTRLWFHNPGASEVTVTVSLLLRGQPNPTPEQRVVTVPAGASVSFDDVVLDLFGLESGFGALRVQTSSGMVAVGSRVFNQPGDSIRDSQGQFMAGVPVDFAARPGRAAEVPGIVQPADGSFRTNFGLVEVSGAGAEVAITLLAADGAELASESLSLGPFAVVQRSLATLAPGVAVDGGVLRCAVIGSTGAVVAYASAVANGTASQDPTTLDVTLDPAVLGSTQGGITAVLAGPGLAGGGEEGVVTLQVDAGNGIEVTSDGVSIRPGGISADDIAVGEVVLGAKVGSRLLTDVVELAAGSNVDLEVDGNTVVISAQTCLGERAEVPITTAFATSSAGSWTGSSNSLTIPRAGRWRVGYRALTEIRNTGFGTVTDPVNVALYDATRQQVIRTTLSVLGLPIGLSSSVVTTVSGDAVVVVDQPTTLRLAARSSRGDLVVTVHPHDVNLSAGLPSPDAASFFYLECLGSD